MKTRLILLAIIGATLVPTGARATSLPCVVTPRPDPSLPVLVAQRAAFGFHDEELVLCANDGTHIAARLWVPARCPGIGGCAGVVMAHGFGFNKETAVADAHQAVLLGMYVLAYDVRGQGASGGQAAFLGMQDIDDEASVLRWWHENVRPTKTAFYGISQGGWLSWAAGIYNCGALRSSSQDLDTPCDAGGRWIDAIAPVQGPTQSIDDGTCSLFMAEAVAESRGNSSLVSSEQQCATDGTPGPAPGTIVDLAHRIDAIDVPTYAVTSFFDRLVPARQVIAAYEELRARANDPNDVMYGKDVRLTMSNDGHGAVGGNFAVTGDIFAWIDHEIAGGPALGRTAPVAIAQEWDANKFRLESAWPIPGSTERKFFLDHASHGALVTFPITSGRTIFMNAPVPASGPEVPFADNALSINDSHEVPGLKAVYPTAPFASTTEITGEPTATIYVASQNPNGDGRAQLDMWLSEEMPDGSLKPFSQARVGLTGLSAVARAVRVPFSVASQRIDAGNNLVLTITPSDASIALPARDTNNFTVSFGTVDSSTITIPIVDVARAQPDGTAPSGASFTDDPVGTFCTAAGFPCP